MFTLYLLTCPMDKKPFYVGITAKENPLGRLEEHLEDQDESVKTRKIKEIKQAGLTPQIVYFGQYSEETDARDAERAWQNFLYEQGHTLTNGEIVKLNTKMAGKLTGSSYSNEDFDKILGLYKEGTSIREIAEETQRSITAIEKIIAKNSYLFKIANCYEQREILKNRGYYWKKPFWQKYILKSDYQAEKAFMEENSLSYKT